MSAWFTLTELQERLNREDRDKLRRCLLSHGVPFCTLGRETFFSDASFVKWIEANETRKPTGESAAISC